MALIEIKSDNLFICQRLREIDESYFVIFNLNKKRYEVHSSLQRYSYCFSVPFDSLDERTIEIARKTRKERQDLIYKEIEEENKKLRKALLKKEVQNLEEALYES